MLMETKRIISVSFLFTIFVSLLSDVKKFFYFEFYILDEEQDTELKSEISGGIETEFLVFYT